MGTHDKHRERLKAKFADTPEILEDHELLELLLFYSIPRKNTNEEAHKILERFGNIKNVFDAGLPALVQVDGIGEKSALFFRVISEVLRRYEICRENDCDDLLEENTSLRKYLTDLFVGTTNEALYLLLFTANNKLICCEKMSEGFSCGTALPVREILSSVLANNAASAILAHNHPGGKAIPSSQDINLTHRLRTVLMNIEVRLKEHYVVAGNQCMPIIATYKDKMFIHYDD